MSTVLAVLKLTGVLITGISAVWALIVEPNSAAKLKARRYLLGLAVFGLVVAFAAQVGDSWKTKLDDDASKARTERLLNAIGRAVTRIDYVSMETRVHWPLEDAGLEKYRQRLEKLVKLAEEANPDAGQESNGLRVTTRKTDSISIFTLIDNSIAFPMRSDGTAFSLFNAAAHPRISIYKNPPDENVLRKFAESGLVQLPAADFTLIPHGGKRRSLIVNTEFDDKPPFTFSDEVTELEVPREGWAQSGQIYSTSDLNGATGIVSIDSTIDVQHLFGPPTLTLYFNGQRVHFEPSQLKSFKGRWATLYLFTFPKEI